jgi:hypothetical protein
MTPSLQVVDKLSAADSMAGLVRDSSQLRMLGVVQSPARPDRSRSAAGAAIPHGGGRIIQAAVPCPGQLPIQKLEIRVAGCQPQVPEEMGYLKAPTHLHINVVAVESQAVSVLRAAAAAAAGQSVIVINSLDEWEKQSGCSKWVLIHFTARGCGAAWLQFLLTSPKASRASFSSKSTSPNWHLLLPVTILRLCQPSCSSKYSRVEGRVQPIRVRLVEWTKRDGTRQPQFQSCLDEGQTGTS